MLKEGSAPIAAYKGGAEMVVLGREMGGDYGDDTHREAVYGSEGVDPLADGRQCSQGIMLEFQNFIQGEPITEVSGRASEARLFHPRC